MSESSISTRLWALLLEIVRHVGPFFGMTLAQVRSLETAYSSSIRQQSVVVELDIRLQQRHLYVGSAYS